MASLRAFVIVPVVALVVVLGACAEQPEAAPLPSVTPTATDVPAAAPTQRIPGGCAALVDVAVLAAALPQAAPREHEITADLLQAGGDECLWEGEGSFAIGVLADGPDAYAQASANWTSPSTVAGAPGEASYDRCAAYVCDIGFLQSGYWVELQFQPSYVTENSGIDYSPAWIAAVTALAHSVADRVAALPAPEPAWQSPVTTALVADDTGCAPDFPTASIAAAVGWASAESGFGVHDDVATADAIRYSAQRSQGTLSCLWGATGGASAGTVSLYLVPGSGWSFDQADYSGWTAIDVAGTEIALADPTGTLVVVLVDSTVVRLGFSGFDSLDPIGSGAVEAAVAATASILES